MSRLMSKASALLVALIVLCIASQAHAQSRSKLNEVDARLQRVENVLDQSLLELLQQIEGLQGEVRVLRGEIENLNNDIEVLKKRNRGGAVFVHDIADLVQASQLEYCERMTATRGALVPPHAVAGSPGQGLATPSPFLYSL